MSGKKGEKKKKKKKKIEHFSLCLQTDLDIHACCMLVIFSGIWCLNLRHNERKGWLAGMLELLAEYESWLKFSQNLFFPRDDLKWKRVTCLGHSWENIPINLSLTICWGIIIPHSGSARVGLYALSGMTTRMYAWSGMTKDSGIWLVGITCHVGNDYSDVCLVGNDQGLGYMVGQDYVPCR